jgi:acetolactate synthase-1/2/3 large subunit
MARLELNLTVMILNDGAYGMIKWKQAAEGFADYGLNFENPDFVKYAESFGAMGHRVETADDLQIVLRKCLRMQGVHVIDVPVDYSENDRVLIKELQEKTCNLE